MKILSEQKSKVLAEKNGWSVDFAEGFLKGEYSRRSSVRLSSYGMVGLDEYCLGLRAGYFERQNQVPTRVQSAAGPEQAPYGGHVGAVTASSSATTFKQGFAY
jgi:hypothetical protein